ncbi:MAG TPA: ATP-dependent helicase HrpB [Steroidobacteraceae bacterium]|nr:ATP-dependent helicase HrpB [Steroidobacteraceae bacterium]
MGIRTLKFPPLPIVEALPELGRALATRNRVILEAPPGAGKSTLVPLSLLEGEWREGQRIVVLEPRRVAARAVARRMAWLLAEDVGGRIGYRTRLDTRTGPDTVIEVVTEGVLTRMLQHDPALEGVACVVFDEFHERSLQADLGLALCLDVQRHLRDSLRLLLMSATLDGGTIAQLLGGAPVLRSTGRMFEVETRHAPPPGPGSRPGALEGWAATVTLRAIAESPGDVLIFMPGAAEIRRCQRLLQESPSATHFRLLPLFGDLTAGEQDAALRPDPDGRRKIVIATNIAETSLTIEGVRIVVDCGLERRSRFDPTTGMSRLETLRISSASAEQRRGRAGRTAQGICYRLWSESMQASLPAHGAPEIAEADLAPLALDLACWGCTDPAQLTWLDPPPSAHLAQARDLLERLGAIDGQGRITSLGRQMAGFGLHPRLAHMMLRAREHGSVEVASLLAALLGERDILRTGGGEADPDLRVRLQMLQGEGPVPGQYCDRSALRRVHESARRIARSAGSQRQRVRGAADEDAAGLLLAYAYPDRIGRARAPGSGRYLLSGGRGAVFTQPTALARHEFIVAAELDAGKDDARIRLAAPVARDDLERHFAAAIVEECSVSWDPRTEAVAARRRRRLGQVVLTDEQLENAGETEMRAALLAGMRAMGLGCLHWTAAALQLRARIDFARRHDQARPDCWPDVSEAGLLGTLEDWFGPWLSGISRREQLARLDPARALASLLDWKCAKRLDEFAPASLTVPSGSRISLDYSGAVPILPVRLQEVFGMKESPRIGDGRVAVTLQLLSPARRPVQLTRDLASFWAQGYADVRKELRGRYPKHYWPEDPLTATPTRRVRPADR